MTLSSQNSRQVMRTSQKARVEPALDKQELLVLLVHEFHLKKVAFGVAMGLLQTLFYFMPRTLYIFKDAPNCMFSPSLLRSVQKCSQGEVSEHPWETCCFFCKYAAPVSH